MKKTEWVLREVLYQAIEKKNSSLTQSYLAKALNISLSTVNLALQPLSRMNALTIKTRHFEIIDIKKALYYWASIRNIEKDIVYQTRVEGPVRDIEKQMPDNIIFGAYSAYKFRFNDVPADYSEVYIYGDEELKKRFKQDNKPANLFVLKKDSIIDKYGKTATIANIFADLWNLRQWYAKDFLKSLEAKIGGLLE